MTTWTTAKAVALRDFLKIVPDFKEHLAAAIPAIETKKGMETGALTGAAHSGGEAIIKRVDELAHDTGGEGRPPFIATGTNEV